jgi:hypothetical protein
MKPGFPRAHKRPSSSKAVGKWRNGPPTPHFVFLMTAVIVANSGERKKLTFCAWGAGCNRTKLFMESTSLVSVGRAVRAAAFVSTAGFLLLANVHGGGTAAAAGAPVIPNRTLPKYDPPELGPNFSAHPPEQEIFRARVFEEPLVPIGGVPTADENSDLAAALLGYARRSGPDDFASLTGFLDTHPQSPWAAALLTGLGLEYYNTAHYSLALGAWGKAHSC